MAKPPDNPHNDDPTDYMALNWSKETYTEAELEGLTSLQLALVPWGKKLPAASKASTLMRAESIWWSRRRDAEAEGKSHLVGPEGLHNISFEFDPTDPANLSARQLAVIHFHPSLDDLGPGKAEEATMRAEVVWHRRMQKLRGRATSAPVVPPLQRTSSQVKTEAAVKSEPQEAAIPSAVPAPAASASQRRASPVRSEAQRVPTVRPQQQPSAGQATKETTRSSDSRVSRDASAPRLPDRPLGSSAVSSSMRTAAGTELGRRDVNGVGRPARPSRSPSPRHQQRAPTASDRSPTPLYDRRGESYRPNSRPSPSPCRGPDSYRLPPSDDVRHRAGEPRYYDQGPPPGRQRTGRRSPSPRRLTPPPPGPQPRQDQGSLYRSPAALSGRANGDSPRLPPPIMPRAGGPLTVQQTPPRSLQSTIERPAPTVPRSLDSRVGGTGEALMRVGEREQDRNAQMAEQARQAVSTDHGWSGPATQASRQLNAPIASFSSIADTGLAPPQPPPRAISVTPPLPPEMAARRASAASFVPVASEVPSHAPHSSIDGVEMEMSISPPAPPPPVLAVPAVGIQIKNLGSQGPLAGPYIASPTVFIPTTTLSQFFCLFVGDIRSWVHDDAVADFLRTPGCPRPLIVHFRKLADFKRPSSAAFFRNLHDDTMAALVWYRNEAERAEARRLLYDYPFPGVKNGCVTVKIVDDPRWLGQRQVPWDDVRKEAMGIVKEVDLKGRAKRRPKKPSASSTLAPSPVILPEASTSNGSDDRAIDSTTAPPTEYVPPPGALFGAGAELAQRMGGQTANGSSKPASPAPAPANELETRIGGKRAARDESPGLMIMGHAAATGARISPPSSWGQNQHAPPLKNRLGLVGDEPSLAERIQPAKRSKPNP